MEDIEERKDLNLKSFFCWWSLSWFWVVFLKFWFWISLLFSFSWRNWEIARGVDFSWLTDFSWRGKTSGLGASLSVGCPTVVLSPQLLTRFCLLLFGAWCGASIIAILFPAFHDKFGSIFFINGSIKDGLFYCNSANSLCSSSPYFILLFLSNCCV